MIPIFSILTLQQKQNMLAVLSIREFQVNETIVLQGESGDLFYIIKDGSVSCSIDGKVIRHMGKGDYFGEQSLLYNTQRTATITTLSPVSVITIKRDDLTSVLGNCLQLIIYRNSQRIAIENSQFLRALTKSQVDLVINHTIFKAYEKNEIVIPRGTRKGQKL